MKCPVIHVDENGNDATGESFKYSATAKAVAEGLMVNEPVILVYPDGRQNMANRVLVTPKGIARLQRTFWGHAS